MFDFVGKRKIFMIMSSVLVLISVILLFTVGFEFGIDFSGGSEMIFSIDREIGTDEIRSFLTDINTSYATSKIVQLAPITGQENAGVYSVTINEAFTENEKTEFEQAFRTNFKEMNFTREAFDEVSGSAAQEIKSYAWYAVIIALILLLVYISLRFKLTFGVGALVALAHDVIIVMGFYALFNVEINVAAVAAFLTLVGYSLNDTIVIYDRIRENMKLMKGVSIEDIVNKSLNETFFRTMLTSITTFIVVFLILLIGGRALAPFAFGLTVGVVVGTYSSLYIASPVVINWLKKTNRAHF